MIVICIRMDIEITFIVCAVALTDKVGWYGMKWVNQNVHWKER